MPLLKLVSLNIERAKHFDRVLPFLAKEKPDVVCLQEVREPDIDKLKESIGASEHIFAPMTRHPSDGNPAVVGTCILSLVPVREGRVQYYHGDPHSIPEGTDRPESWADDAAIAAGVNCALSSVDVEKEGTAFRIATTHFLWSRKGRFSEYQREDMKKLLKLLDAEGEFVLTGDLNAPRGGEIFKMLADQYTDNVPPYIKTSLDVEFHRAGKTRPHELADKMVDGLFSTPRYTVSDCRMVSGLSDHCALVANISTAAD